MNVSGISDMAGSSGGGSSWGMGLSIGGMAEQDISTFIGSKLATDDLLLAQDKVKEQLTKYYQESRPYYEQLAGEFERGRTGLTKGIEEGAYEIPISQFEYRYGEEAPPAYERPEFKFRFEEEPGYEFRRQEGLRALEGSAAARGQALSGPTLQAMQQYGQELASQEYQNAYNRAMGEYKYGTELDWRNALERQRAYEQARQQGASEFYSGREMQQRELQNRFGRRYQAYQPIYQTGAQGTQSLADLIYGYGQQRAGIERDIGNIKAGGWEAAMQAFSQQGQHLQEIGGMGGGTTGQQPTVPTQTQNTQTTQSWSAPDSYQYQQGDFNFQNQNQVYPIYSDFGSIG